MSSVRRGSGTISTFCPPTERPATLIEFESGPETQRLEALDADEEGSLSQDFETVSKYDITAAPSYEVKRVYGELIESCRGFENVVRTKEADQILKENIVTGRDLFGQMEATMAMSDSLNDSQANMYNSFRATPQRRQGHGNGMSEMVVAAVHTNICSKMLRQQVNTVGTDTNAFVLSEFIGALRDASAKEDGEYSELLAVRNLAIMKGDVSRTLQPFRPTAGMFDKDDMKKVIDIEPIAISSQPKPRASRRKDVEDKADITQTEILDKQDDSDGEKPDGLATEIRKTIKTKYKEQGHTPLNMLEIAAEGAQNYHDVIRGLFGVAFVARDGWIEVNKEGEIDQSDNIASLLLKPGKPPAKGDAQQDNQQRSQTIVSFPASCLKQLFGESNTSPLSTEL